MTALVYLVSACLLLTFTSADVIMPFMCKHDPSLNERVYNGHVLFQGEVSHMLDCAVICSKYTACGAFSTSPLNPHSKNITCWVLHSTSFSQNSTKAVMGSKTYCTKPCWLERTCTGDGDCPTHLTVCYAGKCLCQPGYYYSHSRDDCVLDCAEQDLQATFLEYPNVYIQLHNKIILQNCDSEKAQQSCKDHGWCRTVDLRVPLKKCILQDVTALSTGVTFDSDNEKIHYQRTCL